MGTQLLVPKGAEPPIFGQYLWWPNGCMDQMPYGMEVGRPPRPRRLCVRWGPSYPQKKGHTHLHPIFGSCLLWPNVWMDEDANWYGSRRQQRPHCIRRGPAPAKAAQQPPSFGPCLLWPRSPISATAELLLLLWQTKYRNDKVHNIHHQVPASNLPSLPLCLHLHHWYTLLYRNHNPDKNSRSCKTWIINNGYDPFNVDITYHKCLIAS